MPAHLQQVRLPRWLLPSDWPQIQGHPAPAQLGLSQGRITALTPAAQAQPAHSGWNLHGALALPGFVDAHVHLDKTFTLPRIPHVEPGLLGAIEAMMTDRAGWTAEDVRQRAERALHWAWEAGSTRLRTHVDWWEPDRVPVAWPVLRELAQAWRGRVRLERVSLMRLAFYEDAAQADRLARTVAASGPDALLGGFVHTAHWNETGLRHLLRAAQRHDLDVDLHVDEELEPSAHGLATLARLTREIGFTGRVVCGHVCALAAQDEATALRTLDAVARAPITLVSLPATNLLLQDAVTGRTPRQRGLTLVKEARERGIPRLLASDNVQDPFCRLGSYDPVEALAIGALVGQLPDPFDTWSEALCRADWLERAPAAVQAPSLIGAPADLVLFADADMHGFPSRAARRVVLRDGRLAHGQPPAGWLPSAAHAAHAAHAAPAPASSFVLS
ncbi:amidohydrolase family protein [Xenophilus sp. Marseille-Q4582]|uniref:amidohydrolase family protein n=1 Tax=Xenophilus sp. Marseille-Q4582 TaxID=2866600 RepID=UPI001CE445B9|nr:amidohydrolase family protein [Xenophilus sp. Marseille-Q4582]